MKRLLSINLDPSSGVWQIPPFLFFLFCLGRGALASSISCGATDASPFPEQTSHGNIDRPERHLFLPSFTFFVGETRVLLFFPPMAFRESNPLILDKKEKTRKKKKKLFFHSFFCGTVKRFSRASLSSSPFQSHPTLGFPPPFLLPRWRRIFMNIKQKENRGGPFPFSSECTTAYGTSLSKKEEERIG